MQLILASASARRRELLALMGLEFQVVTSNEDEDIPCLSPQEMVEQLAYKKAEAVKRDYPGSCVVGADTIVCLDGQILGKPRDAADARRMLSLLSSRTHTVYTGVAVLTDTHTQITHDAAHVTFAKLTAQEIDAYISTGDPLDKAGSYGLQGGACLFVERIEGSYFTVVGMPVQRLYKMLENVDIRPRWLG